MVRKDLVFALINLKNTDYNFIGADKNKKNKHTSSHYMCGLTQSLSKDLEKKCNNMHIYNTFCSKSVLFSSDPIKQYQIKLTLALSFNLLQAGKRICFSLTLLTTLTVIMY